MNTTYLAALILLLFGVGIYIGVANLTTQYGLEPSSGDASLVICAPSTAEARLNQPVKFTASGLAAGAIYHWSSGQGRTETTADGGLEVRFSTPGQKTVYLFHAAGNRWYRTACSVLIK
jgi:hypothetical protein